MQFEYKILKYLRVSVEDGDEESNSISTQRAYIDAYISEHFAVGSYIVHEIIDDGYSGTNMNRPGIKEVLTLLKESEYNCLIVKDLSRFARDHIETGYYLDHVFPSQNIRVIAINDKYDSISHKGTSIGFDVMIGSLAYEIYSKDLSQKVQSAIRVKMHQGKYIGSNGFYGYNFKNGKLIIDPETAPTVKRIFDEADKGFSRDQTIYGLNSEGIPSPAAYKKLKTNYKSWNHCANDLVWTRAAVYKILNDERYTGKMISGKWHTKVVGDGNSASMTPRESWIITENSHEPIISQELFDRVYEKKRKLPSRLGSSRGKLGIFFCGGCGHRLTKHTKKTPMLKCRQQKFLYTDNCVDKSISLPELLEILKVVVEKQFNIMLGNAKLLKSQQEKKPCISQKSLENEIKEVKMMRFDFYEKYKNGEISKENFDEERDKLSLRLQSLEEQIKDRVWLKNKEASHKVDLVVNLSGGIDFDERFIEYFIERVNVYKNRTVEIVWKFGLNELLTKFKEERIEASVI